MSCSVPLAQMYQKRMLAEQPEQQQQQQQQLEINCTGNTMTSNRRLEQVLAHMNGTNASASTLICMPTSSSSAATHPASFNNNASKSSTARRHRHVIVDGSRTPFVKSFGQLKTVSAIDLSVACMTHLLRKTKLDSAQIDEVILGNVVVNSSSPNIARESVLDAKLPKRIVGTTVSIACLSGLEAVHMACQSLDTDSSLNVILAGGSDSLSSGEMSLPKHVTLALGTYQMGGGNKKGWQGYKELASELHLGSPSALLPQANSIAERSTGHTMGWHADRMAEINKISKQSQDEFAIKSHTNAMRATQSGLLQSEICDVKVTQAGKSSTVTKDNLIRANMKFAAISKLNGAFRKYDEAKNIGTVSAATSSALTDGASVCLCMSEERASQLGYPTDVRMIAYVKMAIDPDPQLLLAPALCIPRALKQAGLKLEDIDLWELHEAFAAQVLTTIAALASPAWCKTWLKQDQAVGQIPLERVNVNGGSLAFGHPFAATGGRLVTSTMHELRRRPDARYALISICAAGGIGGVAILEKSKQ